MFIIAWYVRAAGLVGFDIWKNSWSGNGNQLSTRRPENKQCFSFNSICCALFEVRTLNATSSNTFSKEQQHV